MIKQVLYIDDDPAWREMVTVSLKEAGHNILTAQDASEGLLKADGANLGLIILDLDLAGENGLTLMRFLNRNHPGVPILLFTGMEHDDTTVRSMLDQGADQYLQKGSINELIVTVGTYFRQEE